ncbi:S8 family serine peptidase [Flavobacterium sp. P4023]|uniref:S8 family serine peptidase n=1 Tax=Flavobacterium flabelliforme TaxID=2816119 RepID=A0ABS5CV01_9FLAO|nr:S8 family serine peptidase [Flavobacterium flabelliforme]MBP4142457.1 S8 family serine peptidase [Flavobacterium flabelliforme]
MKTKFIYLLILIHSMSFSQDSSFWKHLIKKESEAKNQKYYFSTLENAHKKSWKIVKKLDLNYCIIETKSLLDKNDLKNILPANNFWKLPATFKSHDESKQYIVATDNIDDLIDELNEAAIQFIRTATNNLILIKSNSKNISKVISSNSVLAVSSESLIPVTESKIADQNFTINQINKANYNFPTLLGENEIISIKDEFLNINDIDLLNKLVPSSIQSTKLSDHATAMATIVSGLGNSSILGKGVAQKSKIQSSDFLKIFPDDLSTLQGATTQNHSYGTEIENFYGSLAATYDEQLFANPFLTHIFSSGNRGAEGFKSLSGNFKQSKNSIVIGCIDQYEKIMSFSSKGPAYDGRIKPELVAYSTQGTSNATALTSGIVTLLKEHFKKITNAPLNNALAKAILINSAKDLGPKGPDYTYGYGSIDADKSLKTISENRFIIGNINHNQRNLHNLTIPPATKNVKITLVWNDMPAAINSAFSLVNDLDLELISANKTVYLPYILNPNSPQELAVTGRDNLNTIEQIIVTNPIAGIYSIGVSANLLSNLSQDYSIAYEFELENKFEWNYPVRTDNFPFDGKTISPFKWDSTLSGKTGQLAISYNEGQSWETIATEVNLEKEQFEYSPTEQKYAEARLKMTVNNVDYLSDLFTISYDLNINSSLVCDGTTEINWNKPTDVNLFNIYKLIGDHLQFTEQISGSTYHYTDGKNYTVTPVFGKSEGIKSQSTLVYESNSNCYFKLAAAEVYEENKVKIDVGLFSIFNIKKIDLIKIINSSEIIIATNSNVSSKDFYLLDENPIKGNNQYKIKLTLMNNTIINSTTINTNYLANSLFLVTPTLVRKNESLYIEAKNEEQFLFYLYNLTGQNVITTPLLSKISSVPLNDIFAGIYIYKIVTKKGQIETGKIIIM